MLTQVFKPLLVLAFLNSPTCEIGHQPPQPRKKKSKFGDSSGPLFSLYSTLARREDKNTTEQWKHEATDGILIFVSPRVPHSCYYAHKFERYRPVYFLLLSPRCSPCPSRTSESDQNLRTPPHSISRTSIRFSLIQMSQHHAHPSCPQLLHHPRSLHRDMPSGEFALVFELPDQPYMCSLGDVTTSMGTSIHQAHSAATMPPREASANARTFFGRRGQDACIAGG